MSFKMAVIGYGGMGSYHCKLVKEKIKGLDIMAIYDIQKEVREKALKEGYKVYQNPKELYEDKEIDLVLVATPNDSHKEYAINCLENGKNVISEKPVTMDLAELMEILEVSKKTGKFFTIHQNRRWDSDFLTIKKILDDGILTKPYMIDSRVQGSRRSLFGWRGIKKHGGGMVLDWGIHLIDQMLMLIPEKVVSVTAHLHEVYSEGVDDNFTALFRFENGLTYQVTIVTNCFIELPRWHMSCMDGTAAVNDWDCNGKIVKLREDEETVWDENIVYTAAGPTRTMAPRPKEATVEVELPKVTGVWAEYYENIVECLKGTAKPIVTPEQAIRVMKVIEAVFEANEKGGAITNLKI